MGVTYKATDLNLSIPVALKILNPRLLQEGLARQRFLREARSAASVRDPNVASVYHLGFRGREIFYAMEFVPGETLECLIKRSGPINAQLTLKIATQIAAGLKAVHRQNLVHRDIKPSNTMVRLETGGGAVQRSSISVWSKRSVESILRRRFRFQVRSPERQDLPARNNSAESKWTSAPIFTRSGRHSG